MCRISIAKKGSISKSSSFKGLKNSSSSQNLKSNNGAKTISSVKSQNVASEITKYTCSNSTLYNEKGKV